MGLLYDADTTVWGNHVTENSTRSLSLISKLSPIFFVEYFHIMWRLIVFFRLLNHLFYVSIFYLKIIAVKCLNWFNVQLV